jgi:hypothetical protein
MLGLEGNPAIGRLKAKTTRTKKTVLASPTGAIGIWRCTCRDWPFSPASKPIDLGLGFQVHWVYIQLGFPASTLVGTLNG